MSEHIARETLARLNLREIAIATHYQGFVPDLRSLAVANADNEEAAYSRRQAEICAAYGLRAEVGSQKPFPFASGIAVIPVHGTLINRFGRSWGYVTGYNYIRSMTAAAGLDPEVKGIVFDHNSHGGEAAGCFECASEIRSLANGKPTMALIDSNCYSASYALATAADKIVSTPSGGAGSIGVVAMHVDMSKMLSDVGITVTFIKAGDHKVDGNPYEALSKEVKADLQKSIDKAYDAFVTLVSDNRKMEASAVRDTQARVYRAEEAMSLGLIDAIATPQKAMQAFFDGLSGSTFQPQSEDENMSTTEQNKPVADQKATDQQLADAAKAAATAERQRMSGILNCEEAKGRTKLANHLAMNTSMSVDDAKAMLAVAAVETPAPAATAPQGDNPFKAAMNTSAHPNVGADGAAGGDGEQDEDTKAAAAILASAKAYGLAVK